MPTINITIDLDSELARVREALGDMRKRAPMVIRTAVNNTAKKAKNMDDRITKKTYTAKGDINNLQLKKATTANLIAELRDKGGAIPMSHFSHYAGKRVGVSAVINTKKGRKRIGKYGNKAFLYNTIMVRMTSKRLPIEKMMSLTSPTAHYNRYTWATIEDEIRAMLYDSIDSELERLLN